MSHFEHKIARIGQQIMALTDELFEYGQRFKRGELLREKLKGTSRVSPHDSGTLCAEVRRVTTKYAPSPPKPAVCTIASKAGPKTHNHAETSLRTLVNLRKLAFGTQSECGSNSLEVLQPFLETCHQQGWVEASPISPKLSPNARHNDPLPPTIRRAVNGYQLPK